MDPAKAAVAELFDRAATTYGQTGVDFFGPAGERLVTAVRLQPGEVVLDLGAGAGACTFPAADAVGPTGRVIATDLAPGMVERIRAEVGARGLAHVDARVGDAEAPDVPPGGVDAVLAGFVLFFVPDPVAALRRYAAALRPGGRLGASWFGPDDERWAAVFAAVRPYVTPAPDRPRHTAFSSVEALEAALGEAGFSSAVTTEEPHVLRFTDAAQWYAWSWSHGLRGMWERVPEDRLDEARAAATHAMEATYDETGRPTLRLMLRYTVAHR